MVEILPFPSTGASPPDADTRREALDIRRSFIVQAPAGSGKTGLLIQRFLKLLADESVTTPEQVLAITFTLKATAEMRDRVLKELEAAALNPTTILSDFDHQTRTLALAVLERDRQLDWSLLTQPNRLNIRTIDSVCAEIARSLPVLSGSGGRLVPMENAQPLHREAARRTVLHLGAGDPVFDTALRDLLLHRDGDLANCELLLAEMLVLRDQWGELVPLSNANLDDAYLDVEVLPRLQAALEHAISTTLCELAQSFPADTLANLSLLASELGGLDGYKGAPNYIAHCAGLSHPPQEHAAHLQHWQALIHLLTTAGGTWRKEGGITGRNLKFNYDRKSHHHFQLVRILDSISHRDDLLAVFANVSALPPAQYPANQWRVAKSLFRVLSHALVELQLVFAERNQCDFTEFSLLAQHALTQATGAVDLAAALGARLQHLLVDEMQDTSASQYELLRLLTESWDGHSQTVFLVGDPRQSIYLFRQARVERFLHAMHTQRLGDLPLTPLRLTANFRSQHTLVDHFNHHFTRIFPTTATEPLPYADAHPILPPSSFAAGILWHPAPLPCIERGTTPTAAQRNQAQRRLHADEIVSIIQDWRARSLPPDRKLVRDVQGNSVPEPWRIAILVRSRSHLSQITAAFTRASIPYRATDIESLNERPEVLDLTALTRALLHPADRVAALAILRAPWCGLSLADLHLLTGADDSSFKSQSIPRLLTDRGHLLPEESCQRLTRVWTVLQLAVAQRNRLTTAQLVERAWRSLGGDAWLTTAELSNARRFFQLLDQIESDTGRVDLTQLNLRLENLYAEPQSYLASDFYVDLLTIHKAKGLEWDVVLVPGLDRKPNFNRGRLLTWSVLHNSAAEPEHILLAPIAAKGENIDDLTGWLNRLHQAREDQEVKRLFYVAGTRARLELHLFASPQTNSSGIISHDPRSLLHAAWPAAEEYFTARDEPLEMAASGASANTQPHLVLQEDADDEPHTAFPLVQRLPANFDPTARLTTALSQRVSYGDPEPDAPQSRALFARPEGSVAARSFGNTIHDSLDLLARRIQRGYSPAALLAELPTWSPRIAALLRAEGLPRVTINALVRDALDALSNTLRDPEGLWLLTPHPGAASEFALTAWAATSETSSPTPTSVRADRIFHAGAEPHTSGDDSLWIIDYKTAHHGPTGLDAFLTTQRATYTTQLEAYARILAPARSKSPAQVRLALYFPTIPRLLWWKADISKPRTEN